MLNKTLSLIDQSFHISAGHWLAVRISDSIVEYCVLDSSKKIIVALESWNINVPDEVGAFEYALEKIKSDSDILKNEYSKTILIPDNPVYTLIPDKLFIAEEARKYLEFNHAISTNEIINVDNISEIAIKNIYQMPFQANSFFRKIFANYEYRHLTTILIKSVLKNKILQEKVLVNIGKHRIDIIHATKEKLKFCNSFKFDMDEDMIYFLLNVYQQLGFDTNIMPVILSGEIEKDSSVYQMIYKYIRNVSFVRTADIIQFAPYSAAILPHRYFTLFNSFVCE
jgi:hypothetical protein